jgi:hypothetical protein
LLVIDGHESQNSLEFQQYCKDNKIITLCMPLHLSHLLQPLDVGCFLPLKKAYGRQAEDLIRNHINHITKIEFLPCFIAAFHASITKSNIQGGFRGAGLDPLNLEAVISKLDVRICTPSPCTIVNSTWQSQTPKNTLELGSQSTLMKQKIQRHIDSSPTSMFEAIKKLTKGAKLMVHSLVLMTKRNAELQAANEAAMRRKLHKRKRVQHEGVLTAEEGLRLATLKDFAASSDRKKAKKRARTDGGKSTQRRCGRCSEPGHNRTTCKQPVEVDSE